jgi:hypothetical protein
VPVRKGDILGLDIIREIVGVINQNKVMQDAKHTDQLRLPMKGVLLSHHKHLELAINNSKDPFNHVTQKCMPIIEEFLRVLGPAIYLTWSN